jgi:ABC-type glycerol-3-phosphate transport system substrate-binding protein
MNNEELNEHLANFLKMFKNRPYHLAKYLIDNSALNKSFLNKIVKSGKLNTETPQITPEVPMTDISEMEDYYNSILDPIKIGNKTVEEITKETNDKMDELIKNEKFEEAAKLRDYMNKKSIKRIK